MAYPDFQITGAGRRSQKKFFRASPQFGLKIRGEDPSPPLGPPLDPPLQLNLSHWATLGVPTNGRSKEVPQIFFLRPGTKGFSRWKWMIDYNFGIDDVAESKFGTHKELIVLNSLKCKYCVSKPHDMSSDHFVKNCKLLTTWWPV